MNPELGQALITVLFGAVAGGVTNALAVWMLFHPYEPPRVFGRRIGLLQGAVPKNKARLASAIGRTVGNKLLTSEDLSKTLGESAFRAAFDEKLAAFVAALLEREHGSLASILPDSVAAELRSVLQQVAARLVERLDAYLDTDEFRSKAQTFVQSMARDLEDQPLGELLTAEREAALAESARSWIADVVEGEGFARAIDDYLERTAHRLLVPGRTFQQVVPTGLVAALERAIAGYLPIALEKLGGMLDDPGARERLEKILHEILDRFMADLRFHQKLVAALLITPETIDRVLVAIEREGAGKISELLHDDEVRDAMARGVNNAIVEFLEKPVVSVLGAPGDPTIEEAKHTIADWTTSLARDEHTRHFVVDKLQAMLRAAEQRTWGEIFRHVPPERIADTIMAALRSARATELYREAADRLIEVALERPIGRLADHLSLDAAARIQAAMADPLWQWLQEQVPAVAQRVDISRKVEQKILEFPTAQVEKLIRGVTERELRLIVKLGYVLGGLIGLASATVAVLLN